MKTEPTPDQLNSLKSVSVTDDEIERDKDKRAELLQAWCTSEDVAMHFNNLLSGFRLKAITGIAVAAVVGVGLKLQELADPRLVCVIFFSLTVIWILVLAADFGYYYRLLGGAVDELLRLERALGNVRLSHFIEDRIQKKKGRVAGKIPSLPIQIFYYVPLLILASASIWFFLQRPNKAPEPTPTAVTSPAAQEPRQP